MDFFRGRSKATKRVVIPSFELVDLRRLCGNDDRLFEAMSYFLLLDPADQERQIGSSQQLSESGAKALRDGNKSKARIDYEFAAKLALCHQDRTVAVKMLELADQASVGESETKRAMHCTLLAKLDVAMDVAEQYYKHRYNSRPRDQRHDEESSSPRLVPVIAKNRRAPVSHSIGTRRSIRPAKSEGQISHNLGSS